MTVYRVLDRKRYRGHGQGETFQANLETAAERRAITRGAIEVVLKEAVSIQPDLLTMPDGWPTTPKGHQADA